MKPWQKGYPLAYLKAYADLFRASLGAWTFGAFGVPKERDVATALKSESLAAVREGDKPVAAAMIRRLQRPSTRTDFRGIDLPISAPSIVVSCLAGGDEPLGGLFDRLRARSAGRFPLYVEAHEERPGIRALLSAHGFSWVGTKVAASSDLIGLYTDRFSPSLLVKPPPEEQAGLVRLQTGGLKKQEIAEILREVEHYGQWEQHYSGYNKRRSWTAFALHGFSRSDPSFIIKPAEMSKAWKEKNPALLKAKCGPTPIAREFPRTLQILRDRFEEFERVRFMRLRAKDGELTRHADITDRDAGVADEKIARLHFPIVTAPGCEFLSWGLRGECTRLHLEAGGLFYLDTRKPHAVENESEVDRIHLVVDVRSSPRLRKEIARGMVATASGD